MRVHTQFTGDHESAIEMSSYETIQQNRQNNTTSRTLTHIDAPPD